MKKISLNIYIPLLVLMFTISAISVFAADTSCDPETGLNSAGKHCYIPLEPSAFPGTENATNNLGGFLGQAFNYIIALAVVLALIMIIWGGIEYMTTDSFSGKDDGKKKIQNAFWGLGLALVSYLVLSTINPCLVDFTGSDQCKNANTLIMGSGKTTSPAVRNDTSATSNAAANKGTAACPAGATCTSGGVKTPTPTPVPGVTPTPTH